MSDLTSAIKGLLVDWGGVMTANLFASFAAFCEEEGLEPQALAMAFRGDESAREMLFSFEEGRICEQEFETHIGRLLGLDSPRGLIDRTFAGVKLEDSMISAVAAAKQGGVKTGLISNSWGTTRYPRQLLEELFEGVVISGEVGIRKPNPKIYELGAKSIGLAPELCVFVDDLPFNLPPAKELGMATIHHTSPQETIPKLEELLGMALAARADH